MTKETRTATFAGREYRYIVHDVESILAQPGVDNLRGLADHAEGASHATWGTFVDEAEVRDRHWHFRPGDVVMDVGPAFGSYTLTAALQGARVFAFEPCEFCRAILGQNIAANPELAPLITVVPTGVHARAGYYDPDAGEFRDEHATRPLESADGTPRQWLRVASLDALEELVLQTTSGGSIHAIKLDVEGAELGAIRSGVAAIGQHHPRLLIEEHEFKEKGIGAECEAILVGLGYGAPVRVGHGSVNHAYFEFTR